MRKLYRLGIVVIVVIVCTACDRAAKAAAQRSLSTAAPVSLLGDLVRFEYTENSGATLGLGSTLPGALWILVLSVLVGIVFLAALVFALRAAEPGPLALAGVALVAAGGLGNLLDRLLNHGRVIDFVSFGLGPLRTGIMNLADIAIFAGAALFLILSVQERRARQAAAS